MSVDAAKFPPEVQRELSDLIVDIINGFTKVLNENRERLEKMGDLSGPATVTAIATFVGHVHNAMPDEGKLGLAIGIMREIGGRPLPLNDVPPTVREWIDEKREEFDDDDEDVTLQ